MNGTHPTSDEPDSEQDPYQRPDGTPKKTGRTLSETVVFVRVDDTSVTNERVAIHIEHPDHDGGVRCFYRHKETADRSIRRHIDNEIDADLERVELTDTVGLGLEPSDLLPEAYWTSESAAKADVGRFEVLA